MREKCLVKMEKALNLRVEDTSRKHVPVDSNVCAPESTGPLKRGTPCRFLPVGWLHRCRDSFGLKSRKMTGEAASADEEAAVIPAELAKDEGCVLAAVSGIHGGLEHIPRIRGLLYS